MTNQLSICLAPMDGVTTPAFRQVMRHLYPNLILYSEFTNVDKIISGDLRRINFIKDQKPYIVQIYGNDPDKFAQSCIILNDYDIDGIDINMGCSNKKIANSQHGCALMQNKAVAAKIVAKCKLNSRHKISVKTRLGWNNKYEIFSFAKALTEVGLDMLIVHGRTYQQKFKGYADWLPIYELKKQLNIKIIGNGDLLNIDDGLAKVKNLDGFMIGRGAIANPFCFFTKEQTSKINIDLIAKCLKMHLYYDLLFKTETNALREIRKYLQGYLQYISKASDIRARLMATNYSQEFYDIVEQLNYQTAPNYE